MKAKRPVRVAVYTRKSTSEGLEQEFNSLDAQREAAEAFVQSQIAKRWECLPDRYDDVCSGGDMKRPALLRLLENIADGKVDCVAVYKVDRLSRSLTDFTKIIEHFEEKNVSFVSVTQDFNTASSMGRLTLNILLSFAQFEREIIAERTRDKMGAARKKGRWTGGRPPLGYDLAKNGGFLKVNRKEASRIEEIFRIYLESSSLSSTVKELRKRGWTTKEWVTRSGKTAGGSAFSISGLSNLLRNTIYLGKVHYRGQLYQGKHRAILDQQLFEEVQRKLALNDPTKGNRIRNKHSALLKGILKCGLCSCSMVPSRVKKDSRTYRYYVCSRAMKDGWNTCEVRSLPAGEIETYVVKQFEQIGRNVRMRESVTAAVRSSGCTAELPAIENALDRFYPIWDALEPSERMEMIKKVLETVIVFPEEIEITFRPGVVELLEIEDVA